MLVPPSNVIVATPLPSMVSVVSMVFSSVDVSEPARSAIPGDEVPSDRRGIGGHDNTELRAERRPAQCVLLAGSEREPWASSERRAS